MKAIIVNEVYAVKKMSLTLHVNRMGALRTSSHPNKLPTFEI